MCTAVGGKKRNLYKDVEVSDSVLKFSFKPFTGVILFDSVIMCTAAGWGKRKFVEGC